MEEDMQSVLEDVVFILNDVRRLKLKELEKMKLSPQQFEKLKEIDKDVRVCVTKLGLVLHPTEL